MDNPMSLHDELAGLATKATPGPWVFDGDWARRPCINAGPKEVAQIYKKGFPARDDHRPDEAANAALIVVLRNNLPAILSALNAADEVKRLREALGAIAAGDVPISVSPDLAVRYEKFARAALNQGPGVA